jgi:hypothetical protein
VEQEEYALKKSRLNVDWTGKWIQIGYGKKAEKLESAQGVDKKML